MDSTNIENFVRDELNAETFAEWIASDTVYVLVATDGAMLVGYSVCINDELPLDAQIHHELPSEGAVMMSKFYVHPEFHGARI